MSSSVIDIEDLTTLPELSHPSTSTSTSTSTPPTAELVLHRRLNAEQKQSLSEAPTSIPSAARVYIKTYGCSHNASDSEYMAGLLSEYGYDLVDDREGADVVVINSCSVKNPTETVFGNLVEKCVDDAQGVVVAGCVPQAAPENGVWGSKAKVPVSAVGVEQIDTIVQVVEETLAGNVVRNLGRRKGPAGANRPALSLPKIRRNELIEIIPINTGCLNACTYCKTKGARGDLASYHPLDIIDRVRAVVEDEGVKEIRLTSEDTGTYGRDIGSSLPELLWGVLRVVEKHDDVMVRLGMTNPPYILDDLDEMAAILAHPNMYRFLHIPVQAGSNRVLDAMRREYTREQFELVCDTLLTAVPDLSISTDVICGFPSESDVDFAATTEILEKYAFPFVNISQFYPRPGTPAAKMTQLPSQTKKARSRAVSKIVNGYTVFDHLIGQTLPVWITEVASDGTSLCGHTRGYVQVLLDPDHYTIGTRDVAYIVSASRWSVRGIPPSPPSSSLFSALYSGLFLWLGSLALALLVLALAYITHRWVGI